MTVPLRRRSVALVAILALTTACTSSHGSAGKTSSTAKTRGTAAASSAAETGTPTIDQLKAALIPASAITVDKFTLTGTTPVSQSGAVGISGVYANPDHKRVVSIILIHFPTAAYAQAGLAPTQSAAATELTRNPASDTPVDLGQGTAHLYQGSNETGPLSIIVFAEGNYIVTMEFVSKAKGDGVPAKIVTDLAKAKDAKIKS